jgi:hypothetical protein
MGVCRHFRDSLHWRVALAPWIKPDNQRRPHGILGHQAPAERLRRLSLNNVLRNYNVGSATGR